MITAAAFRQLVLGSVVVLGAACGGDPDPDLGTVTSNAITDPPPPVYSKFFNDAVTGPAGSANPVVVNGTIANCPPSAKCYIAPPNPLPPPNTPPSGMGLPPTTPTPVDNYRHDVYERPAGRGTNASTYIPGIDIVSTQAGLTSAWVYYRINLNASPTHQFYAFEINYDADPSGDALVELLAPSTNLGTAGIWGTAGLSVYDDANGGQGGSQPVLGEGPGTGGSYEHKQFQNGTNFAPAEPGGAFAVQARVVGSSLEVAVFRPFLATLQGSIVTAAFRPYAATTSIDNGDIYLHDDNNRIKMGSPYPWLQIALPQGASFSCPGGSNGDNNNSLPLTIALDSGTRVNTGILNPCYATVGVYEFDNAGTVSDFAYKTDGELQFMCGNGNLDPFETCDDGNLINTDSCTTACEAPRCGDTFNQAGAGETCDDGNLIDDDACSNLCRVAACGDGILQTGEACDDGNLIPTDTCTATCTSAVCGDGVVRAGVEACDDGNGINNDACSNTCRTAGCGDGIVQAGEGCDDGNGTNTDACLNTCLVANCGDGYRQNGVEVCDDGNAIETDTCLSTCVAASCGDGFTQTGVEQCDDANGSNTDACLTTCKIAGCGDGFVQVGVEPCDDGNADNTDSCTNQCTVATCGDGFAQFGEACDDGNQNETDACLSTCAVASCGDGFTQLGVEECDDDNLVDTDACTNACQLAGCGDAIVQVGLEQCDDGNQIDNDACRNNCVSATCGDGVIRVGAGAEQCDDGDTNDTNACTNACTTAICGDGIVRAGLEQCDDANGSSTDGCISCVFATCGDGFIQAGFEECDDTNTSNTDTCTNACQNAECGDGFVQGTEQCDDADTDDTDACRNSCVAATCGDGVVHTGVEACDDGNLDPADQCTNSCALPTCGDAVVQPGEACDDGNPSETDSCRTNCTLPSCGDGFVQSGETCDDADSDNTDACPDTCQTATCGDGFVLANSAETCDDGNGSNTDGCLTTCVIATCGDGVVWTANEACDDANGNNLDGCTTACELAVCGDGFLQPGEACDDGNLNNNDACRNSCMPATCGDGFLQTGVEVCDDGNPSNNDGCLTTCMVARCGDGILNIGIEACDDGNTSNTDTCTNFCRVPGCGDGIVQAGEACDDGNQSNTDACRTNCVAAACGDGLIQTGVEACDDGNTVATDSCTATCTTARCGDGVTLAGVETCDDGNTTNGDTCTNTCASARCGDGVVQVGVDVCDDGNAVNGDGCETSCLLTNGQPCTLGQQCDSMVCDPVMMVCEPANVCGNGIREGAEICDDGNTANGDGCETSCRLTNGQPCTLGPQCDSFVCDPVSMVCEPANVCGNGVREGTEVCDDGNITNGDGCESSCLLTNGEECTVDGQCDSGNCDNSTNPGSCEPLVGCGNGIRGAGEGCDDGNTASGDGCSAACEIENGFPCNQTPPGDVDDASCQSNVCDTTGGQPGVCEPAQQCGNSVREGAEICDDGNLTNGDGCESTCKLSLGEMCTMDVECQSGNCDPTSMTCEPAVGCGNSILNAGEGCDDGDNTPGDGCNATCDIENTFPCNATAPGDIGNPSCESTVCDQSGGNPGICERMQTCGNNKLEAGEGCDDGGTTSGDGCTGACKIEDGDACNADTAGATGDASCASNACNDTVGAPGVCGGTDTDGDLVFNFDDIDDDNDGLLDTDEGGAATDTDGDGTPNSLDLDSDDDGICDATETRHAFPDENGDFGADCPGSVGANGLCDALETTPESGAVNYLMIDTDGDTVRDYRDLDSDNDGLADLHEGGFGCLDANDNGVCDGPDADGDGIATSIDSRPAGFGNAMAGVPTNSDTDTTEDYRDLDSDGDSVYDIIESKNKALDANIDGVVDATADRDSDGIRDVVDDSDLDGIPDSEDPDPASFGGLHDAQLDTDGDDDPDQQDPDSDEDLVGDGPDNCRLNANPGQQDIDDDGIGDECDSEDDRWGLQGGGCGCGTTTTSPSGSMLVLGLAVMWTLGRRRRRRQVSAAAASGLVIVGMLAIPAVGHAQAPVVQGDFSTERFQLSTDADGILDVESAVVRKHLALDLGLWLGYANDPLTLNRPGADHERQASLVSNQVGGELVGALGLFGRVQVGIAVPLVLLQNDDGASGDPTMPQAPASSFAVGDIRLIPKVQLLWQRDQGIDLAFVLGLTFPTSSGEGFAGDTNVTATPALALSRNFGQGMRGALNLGYRIREEEMAIDLEINDELFAGIGLGYDLAVKGGPPLEIDAGFSFATAANDAFGAFNRNYAEVKGGASYDLQGPLRIFAAMGAGLAEGYGTPDWRMLAGLRVDRTPKEAPAPAPVKDTDFDSYLDPVDKCPTDPEDFDKFEDEDGCPDLDDDKDTIPDTADQCRLEPEDLDGFEDANGCPELDNDGDKILDLADKCPIEPEDLDAFQDEDGCPELDNDNDTIPDAADPCPLVAGPVENKGCPWPDRDGDTVEDRFDNCPDEPGKVELQGCNAKQLVKITGSKLELLETVYFQTSRAVIQKRSYKLLDNVASVIKSHPNLAIKIEGHTDDVGKDAFNLKLSTDRAAAAVTYLVKKGVEATRLSSEGFGEAYPIAENKRAKGRAANRRVEFAIVGTVEIMVPAPTVPATPAPAAPPAPAPTK